MKTLRTVIDVKGLYSKEVADFLLNCNDENYQNFSKGFEKAIDEHVKIEFPKMRDMLHGI